MVPRKLLNVAGKFHRHSAGRTVYRRQILGPLSELDVQWWRVAARHDASRSVTVAAGLRAVQCQPFVRIATFHAS
jgi:hypothetical protein